MLEAVGHEFYPDFFHHCDRLLAVDGIMVVQVKPHSVQPHLCRTATRNDLLVSLWTHAQHAN